MSARPVLWMPRRLSDATVERARRDYDLILNEADTPGTAEEIVAMSARVDAMMPCHSERFPAEVVARLAPRLKIVANQSVGVDHCDLKALARAFRWKSMLESGEYATIAELAEREGISLSYLTRVLRLTLLAPDIVETILDGRQGSEVTLARVLEQFPLEWKQQSGRLNHA